MEEEGNRLKNGLLLVLAFIFGLATIGLSIYWTCTQLGIIDG